MRVLTLIAAVLALALPAQAQETRILDAFETLTPWSADASTDVSSAITAVPGREGQAMRITYDFNGKSGYAFAARALSFEAPENYEISFWVRGETRPNTFEVKFVDATGDNVHWRQTQRYDFPGDWTLFTIKKRQVTWAWGPKADRTFRGAERVEFVVTAGEGGAGWIEVDQLDAARAAAGAVGAAASGGRRDQRGRDGDGGPGRGRGCGDGVADERAGAQSLTLDLGYEREFGGLTLRWGPGMQAAAYRVMASSDREDWRELVAVAEGDGGVDWLRTPEASARWLRLDLLAPAVAASSQAQMGAGQMLGAGGAQAYALGEVEVETLAFGETPTKFLTEVAGESRRGLYPRGFVGEQPYWTLVGVDGGGESGLISEDGAIELRRGGPSVEPFVLDNGRLVGWADVEIEQGLVEDDLPIPTVTWTHDEWTMKVTAMADGVPERAMLYGLYELTNTSSREQTLTLALMARPMQVNGPVQFPDCCGRGQSDHQDRLGRERLHLERYGNHQGTGPVDPERHGTVRGRGRSAGPDRNRTGAAAEMAQSVSDPAGLAAAAFVNEVTLAPGETRTLGFRTILAGEGQGAPFGMTRDEIFGRLKAQVADPWREKIDRFDLIVPPQGQRIEDTMKTSLAHTLMSRQGPVLQPGTRSYNRSWIRDGAMMAEGLNRLGHAGLSADYLRFYAPYVFDNGKVPCCVDSRGSDPVPENDSHGEFIFLAAETYRYTRDEALLRSVWPQVQKAIGYMDGLRASTRTAEFQTAETRHLYGLLPPTISHEGYSDKIAYSYWDDFWGLLGYKDAVFIAETLGDTATAARIAAARDEFATDINNAITGTAIHHGIDWIAGAADRGDFDATSTTIGLSPAGLQADLPQGLMKRTFEKYWENFTARRENRTGWRDYTPYELRTVGAFVRLGQRERAMEALDFFFADRRPEAWNGWAEVVGRDLREPRFIGDMPHAWISSDYIRSALDMFVYERDADQALVLAAGLPLSWVESETGVGVRDVRTAHGALTYLFKRERGGWVMTLSGDAVPPGGFVVQWPEGQAVPERVRIDGRGAEWDGLELKIPAGARRVELR